jgi:3-methyl-2-oxobutanoate hydroxymethyltransferase
LNDITQSKSGDTLLMSRITVPAFSGKKRAGEKITMLTAYDYTMARLLDAAGVDGILVGDSLAMVVQGHENTLPATLDEMIYHAEMVGRAAQSALVVVDMPFPTNLLGPYKAIENAARILKESACQAVKLEVGAADADVIAALTGAGIPVMAHCGLRPQSVHNMGGYKVQRNEKQLLLDVQAAENAGAFAVVLECVPTAVATQITSAANIPTIGIGAGVGCDGQILVVHDLLGIPDNTVPKHVKAYATLGEQITTAVKNFCEDVRSEKFPTDEQGFD